MSIVRSKSPAIDVVTIVVLAGAFALTSATYDRLPNPMPTHFDLAGHPNGWMPRAVGAWLVPVLTVGLVAVLRFSGRLMPSGWSERLQASPMRLVALLAAATTTGVQILVLRASLATTPRLGDSVWLVLGASFVAFGLVLPRTRRNPFFGVRTPFALASDENWTRTQRVGSYSMTMAGVVALAAGLLGSPSVALAAIIVSVVAPVLWSWMVARRGPGDIPPMSANK